MAEVSADLRVLIVAPLGRDAAALADVIRDAGADAVVCAGLADCCSSLAVGAGALLLTEEAFDGASIGDLVALLQQQPPWSELPIVVLTRGPEASRIDLLRGLGLGRGVVTLLERPLSPAIVASVVRTALRARRRQYQVRDLLAERDRSLEALQKSEERLRQAARVVGFGVFEHDHAGGTLHWSPEIRAMHEWPDAAPDLERLLETVHPEDRGAHVAAISRAHDPRGDGVFAREYRVIARDGSIRWLSVRSQTFFEGEGGDRRAVRTIGAELDVTERKRIEQELRRQVEDTARILDALPAAVWIAEDPACEQIVGNRAANQLLGVPTDTNVSQSIPEPERHTLRQFKNDGTEYAADELPMQRAAASGEPVHGADIEMRLSDGRQFWLTGNAIPLFDGEGRVRGALAAFVDVTERKRAEDELRRADRRKDEFLATLAHELRNPLAPMRSALQIMRMAGVDRVHLEQAIGVLERQLKQLVRLVDDLLDISRISRGALQLRREHVDLRSVVASAIEIGRPLVESRRHTLEYCGPDEPVAVDGDPMRLAQVVSNLLNNAAHYTPSGGRIAVSLDRDGQHAIVSVADNGIGIPVAARERVFEMFTQLSEGAGVNQGGLGVGLSLVRAITELHGGSIDVRTGPGDCGTEFIVRLPVVARGTSRAPVPSSVDVRGRSLRVLVADDNRDAANSLCLLLQLLGHTVRVAHDGGQAVREAEAFRPHLVFMDLGMPHVDGFEAARRIRASDWGKSICIVALTGWGQDEHHARSRAAGCDAHLVKPVEPAALDRVLLAMNEDAEIRLPIQVQRDHA